MTNVSTRTAVLIVAATILVAGGVGVYRYKCLRRQNLGLETSSPFDPLHVPLWVPVDQVRHKTRFACRWDGPTPLARFRQAESLDAVVGEVASDEERARKLLHWTRAQFEPGRPDPYPPPDAMTTLSEIRAGRTGGFCAQYAFVLVQALQSFGKPARVVTIVEHEVVETWLADQSRWTMLDPLFELQVIDQNGRCLSAIEIRNARHAGATLAVTAANRLAGSVRRYVARYDRIGLWIRNAFVSEPTNFTDFDRYRVWLVRSNERSPSPESLSTTHPEGLYAPPADFPESNAPSSGPGQFQLARASNAKKRNQPQPRRDAAWRSESELSSTDSRVARQNPIRLP